MQVSPLLAGRSLHKRFDRRVAVHDVSLAVRRGEILALLGPNGAGKTTTLRLLAGLIRPTAGTIVVNGVEQTARTWPGARAAIGVLPEAPGLWDRLSIEANLLVFARLLGVAGPRRRVATLLEEFDLGERARHPAGTLSKGMRQKVALARALLHEPRILLLDEPTAGLDPAMTRTFRDLLDRLRRQGCGIIVSTHNLDEAARVADRVAVLDQTVVAVDAPDELARRWATPRVRVVVSPPADRFADVLARAGARDVAVSSAGIDATVADRARDVPRIVRALVEAGAEIHAVAPAETTLEDAYLAITRAGAPSAATAQPPPLSVTPPPPAAIHPAAPDTGPRGRGTGPPSSRVRGGEAMRRVAAIIWKEWQELRQTWAPWLPGLFILPVLALPFVFTWVLPAVADEPVDRSDFADQFDRIRPLWPAVQHLTRRAAIEAFLFQQFLVLLVLVPATGAMSIAAHAIIGEKQTRSLEPLLASPLRPLELLLAKVLAALAPALVLEGIALALYAAAIAATADAGVIGALASGRSAITVFLLGPLAALFGLQLVVLSSTRARDPRSAQQIGVLVVIPIVGILIAQGAGAVWLSTADLLAAAGCVAVLWAGLLALSAARFDAERVLTRWT